MDVQTLFNTALASAIALIGGLGSFVLKAVWEALKDLQKEDSVLITKVHSLENEMSNGYVKKDEFTRVTDLLFSKLDAMNDRFSSKLDIILVRIESKVNRDECKEYMTSIPRRRRETDQHEDV